jgi:hypothetical protein
VANEGGGGVPGIVIWLGVLVVFDVLSYVFHWGFILY